MRNHIAVLSKMHQNCFLTNMQKKNHHTQHCLISIYGKINSKCKTKQQNTYVFSLVCCAIVGKMPRLDYCRQQAYKSIWQLKTNHNQNTEVTVLASFWVSCVFRIKFFCSQCVFVAKGPSHLRQRVTTYFKQKKKTSSIY